MIECVSIETNHHFNGNPLAAQHRLRFKSITERQGWEVPTIRNMEYDAYDNPATIYLIHRNGRGEAQGVSRLYPTDRPYMLKEKFSYLACEELPSHPSIWEGSRFCVDETLPPDLRRRIIQEIIVGYLEFGLDQEIGRFIGVMHPVYWRNIFTKSGWDIDWLGDLIRLDASDSRHTVRAGGVKVSEENLKKVRKTTGIKERVLVYRNENRIIHEIANDRTADQPGAEGTTPARYSGNPRFSVLPV